MDTRTPQDRAWDAIVSTTAGATPAAAADAAGAPWRGDDAHRGFLVLSLEQYAADHARSLCRGPEHHPADRRSSSPSVTLSQTVAPSGEVIGHA